MNGRNITSNYAVMNGHEMIMCCVECTKSSSTSRSQWASCAHDVNESCVDCDVDGDDDDDQHISVDCRDVDLIDAEDLLLGRS